MKGTGNLYTAGKHSIILSGIATSTEVVNSLSVFFYNNTLIMLKLLFLGLFTLFTPDIYSQVLKKPIPDKLVVLTFDDAVKSHFTNVAPILKKYHFGATFFVCEFPPDFADTSKYMKWDQIQQLSNMGFEIGNHSKNHLNVEKLSKADFIRELDYIEMKCKNLNISHPINFAYPGYQSGPAVIAPLTKMGYAFARTGGNRLYDPETDHPYLVPSFTTLSTNRKEIMDAFSLARDGKVVLLTFHGIPDNAHAWVTTPTELFKEYMQFLHNNHYKVIAMKDLLEYINVDKALKTIKPVFESKPIGKRQFILIMAGIIGVLAALYKIIIMRKKHLLPS